MASFSESMAQDLQDRHGSSASELAFRADEMEASDLPRALAAWDYLELALIVPDGDEQGYLDIAKKILDGGDYTS